MAILCFWPPLIWMPCKAVGYASYKMRGAQKALTNSITRERTFSPTSVLYLRVQGQDLISSSKAQPRTFY